MWPAVVATRVSIKTVILWRLNPGPDSTQSESGERGRMRCRSVFVVFFLFLYKKIKIQQDKKEGDNSACRNEKKKTCCTDMITWQGRQIEDCGSTQCQTHSWREKPVNPTGSAARFPFLCLASITVSEVKHATSGGGGGGERGGNFKQHWRRLFFVGPRTAIVAESAGGKTSPLWPPWCHSYGLRILRM